MMLGEWELESGKRVMKYSYDFLTYKDGWDKIKEDFCLTDEELRICIGQALQMWAWTDILPEVRAAVEYERERQV